MSRPSPAHDPARYDVLCLRASNPGPLSLSGTNTYIVGRAPAFVIDPGPALDEHLAQILSAVRARGGLGGIALTHDHVDHCEAVERLRAAMPAPLAAARAEALRRPGDVRLADGTTFGPLRAIATPGHAPDHFAFLYEAAAGGTAAGGTAAESATKGMASKSPAEGAASTGTAAEVICFTGDAVLGEGSVFIAPDPGALRGYMHALQRLRELPLTMLFPGHGPAIADPRAKLTQYIEHREERERGLIDALAAGRRTVAELLDAAWSEVPAQMRPVAALSLLAHLDKLAEEDRLPAGVQRPSWASEDAGR